MLTIENYVERSLMAGQVRQHYANRGVWNACYSIVGSILAVIPLLFYNSISNTPSQWQLYVQLAAVFALGAGIFLGPYSLYRLFAEMAYARLTRQIVLDHPSDDGIVTFSSKGRRAVGNGNGKDSKRMNETVSLEGKIIYSDGRSESRLFRALGDLSAEFATVGNLSGTIFGAPLSYPEPLMMQTSVGTFVTDPDPSGLWYALWSPIRRALRQADPVTVRLARSASDVCFCFAFFQFLMLIPFMHSTLLDLRFVYAIFLAFFCFFLAEVIETIHSAKQIEAGGPIIATVILSKKVPMFAAAMSRCAVRAQILIAGETEPQTLFLSAQGNEKCVYGQPVEVAAYKDLKGRLFAVKGRTFTLWKTRVGALLWLPLILYVGLVPTMYNDLMSRAAHLKKGEVNIPNGNAYDYYYQGVDFKTAGRTENARKSLHKAIALSPNAESKLQASRFLLTQVPLNVVPEDAQEMNIQAVCEMDTQAPANSIRAFEKCMAKYPTFEWPYRNLGLFYLELNQPEKAVPLLERALQLNPHYENAIGDMTEAQFAVHNREKGLEYLKQLTMINPDDLMLRFEALLFKYSI